MIRDKSKKSRLCFFKIVIFFALLDTTQYKDILETSINELILQVLSFVAEQESVENTKLGYITIEVWVILWYNISVG